MEPLKIFATVATPLTASQLHSQFEAKGWRLKSADTMAKAGMVVHLEHSGSDIFLAKGYLDNPSKLDESIQELARAFVHCHYSIDFFEEDGRLVRRAQG